VNFVPQMDRRKLVEGYLRVIATVYDPTLENYFERCLTLFKHLKPQPHFPRPLNSGELYRALMTVRQRLSRAQLPAYSRFCARVSKDHPSMLPEALLLAALGYHFEKITRQQTALQAFKDFLESELTAFREATSHAGTNGGTLDSRRRTLLARVDSRYRSIPAGFRFDADGIDDSVASFRSAVNEALQPSSSLPAYAHPRPVAQCGTVCPRSRRHEGTDAAVDRVEQEFGYA